MTHAASPAPACRRRRRRALALAILTLAGASGAAAAPSCEEPGTGWCVAQRFAGTVRNAELGFRFGEPLDADGDGGADPAAGARFTLSQKTQQSGTATVWSGASGAVVRA